MKEAPHLKDPQIIKSEVGTHPVAVTDDSVDLYALTHNETSTGVMMSIERPDGAKGLVAVDATSGAGGLMVDASQFDCYYFAPQKSFASDGGLWLAVCSPAAIERIESLAASGRWTPAFFDLKIALDNSRLNQTYNTPALATIHMLASQIKWMNDNGGLSFSVGTITSVRGDSLHLGRGVAIRPTLRSESGSAQQRGRDNRLRRRDRRDDHRQDPSGQRNRGYRSVSQTRSQSTTNRDVSERRF